MKAVRKAKGMTLAAVVDSLSLKSTGFLSQVERGEKDPSPSLVDHFRRAFSVSENWWNSGEGQMFSFEENGVVAEEAAEYNGGYIAAVSAMMREMDLDTQKDIFLSVQKEKLLRELLKERLDKKAS